MSVRDERALFTGEPLQALAETAQDILQDALNGCAQDCKGFHGSWPFTQLFNLLPTTLRDKDFIADQTAAAVEAGARKLVISGAADDGILKAMLSKLPSPPPDLAVHVIDLCDTPLKANVRTAERLGVNLSVAKADLRAGLNVKADVIVAHNLLPFSSPEDKQVVVRAWADALSSGGLLCAVNRIKPKAAYGAPRFPLAVHDEMVQRILDLQSVSPYRDLITPELLADLFREALETSQMWYFRSKDEVITLLEEASFRVLGTHTYSRKGEVPSHMPDNETIRISAVRS